MSRRLLAFLAAGGAAAAMALALAGCASNASARDESGSALREETGPHQIATGRIARVNASRTVVVVDRAGGGRLLLHLNTDTVITKDGKATKASAIREGSPIRAAYRVVRGKNDALVIDVSRLGEFPPTKVQTKQTP